MTLHISSPLQGPSSMKVFSGELTHTKVLDLSNNIFLYLKTKNVFLPRGPLVCNLYIKLLFWVGFETLFSNLSFRTLTTAE